MLSDLSVGDEIVTAGGLYGEVREVHDDEVLVRIAPELDVRVARRAVAGIVTADEPEELTAPDEPEQTGPTPGT
jgi:preprotein translocase subunit YajC